MTILGSTEPRVYTPPLRELTRDTSLGFDVVDFAHDVLGVTLLPWQRWLYVHALEIVGDFDGDWHFRFRTVLVLVARQNGKTMVSEILSLFFLYVLGVSLVIGTSTNLDAAEEVWEGVVSIAEDVDELSGEIDHVTRSNGKKTLSLTGSRRYKVKPATRKGARGQSGDLVLLDELREHQDWSAWSAVSKTTNARPNAIIWCMSNAGDGTSVVLRSLRIKAHAAIGDPDGVAAAFGDGAGDEELGDDDMPAVFEWSAHHGADVHDRSEWALANPSLGYGFMTERALAASCATDPEGEFRTECLCQWVEAVVEPPFPEGAWDAALDEGSAIAPDSPVTFGVDVSADRSHSSICACGKRADGQWHVELVAYQAGIGWLLDWFKARADPSRPMRVALQANGAPISSVSSIIGAVDGVEVVECAGKDVAAWCGRMWDAVAANVESDNGAEPVRHLRQPALDLAANVAQTRPLGDGAWAWNRNGSREDISPIVAATMALGCATEAPAEVPSVYEGEELLVLD
jgi:hypothetical protein